MNVNAPFPGTSRGAFVARVSAALERKAPITPADAAPPPPATVNESVVRVVGAGEDLPDVFAKRAAAAGMMVHKTTGAALTDDLVALVDSLAAGRVAIQDRDSLAGVLSALRHRGRKADLGGTVDFAALYDVDAGITDVQAAIAETGSLVCSSGSGRGRGLSLVPPLHIAVVWCSQIVPDLVDYWASHAGSLPQTLPSSIVLITGPSKTADIEGVLITGVHGPREVHVMLVLDA